MKTLLSILLFFVTLTSFISGVILIAYPDGSVLQMPVDLLAATPFRNFLIPGIVLATCVGGSSAIAFLLNTRGKNRRYEWSMIAGLMTCGWVLVQMILINTVFWLQFVYLGVGIVMILIFSIR